MKEGEIFVSIHRLLRALPAASATLGAGGACFDPQALTSLTLVPSFGYVGTGWFRSTGSYEPDPRKRGRNKFVD